MAGSPIFSVNKILANLNYHMSIKTSQAILKCFVDLKCSVWSTLASEDEIVFCDTYNFFQLDCPHMHKLRRHKQTFGKIATTVVLR